MRSGRRQRQANTSTLTCWSPSRSLLIIVPHQSNACCLCWVPTGLTLPLWFLTGLVGKRQWSRRFCYWQSAPISKLAASNLMKLMIWLCWERLGEVGVESCCLQGGCHFVYEYLHATCSNLTFSQSFWTELQWNACLNLRALPVNSPWKARPLIDCRVFGCFLVLLCSFFSNFNQLYSYHSEIHDIFLQRFCLG